MDVLKVTLQQQGHLPGHTAQYWPKPTAGSARRTELHSALANGYLDQNDLVQIHTSYGLTFGYKADEPREFWGSKFRPVHLAIPQYCVLLLSALGLSTMRSHFYQVLYKNAQIHCIGLWRAADRNTAFNLMSADKNTTQDDTSSWAAHFHTSLESLGRLGGRTGSRSKIWVPTAAQLCAQCYPGKAAHQATHWWGTQSKWHILSFASLFLNDGP